MQRRRGDTLRRAGLAFLVLAVGLAAVGVGGADGAYGLDTRGSIDTPTRTVQLEGQSHTVSGISQVAPGDPLDVEVTAPDGESYRVYLYNANRRIVVDGRGTGPTDLRLTVPDVEPGGYVLAVQHRGVTEAVHPVVVRGYDVTVRDVAVESAGRLRADVSVTQAGEKSLSSVEVVVANGSTVRSVPATERESGEPGTYTATVPVASTADEPYRLYALVRGQETVRGRQEPLGLSNVFTVQPAGDGGQVSPSPGDGSPGDGRKGAGGTTPAETPTDATPNDDPTTTSPSGSDGTPSDGDGTPARGTDGTRTDDGTPTDSGVITPNPPTDDGTGAGATSSRLPGYGPALALVSLVAAGLLARRAW